ncbi:hypothetical protein T4B_9335 [Trichinella pseudospiralis]|uniref:Uncharacterized protein n=1 Tax=Trichinella pseudospiralis TaxID=6337 RepID=A0A0V1GDT6_TRIPS|nr:hypothetical protein T4B_9335 [Trichinella pseudospiralis]
MYYKLPLIERHIKFREHFTTLPLATGLELSEDLLLIGHFIFGY